MFIVNFIVSLLLIGFRGYVLSALFNWFVAANVGFTISTGTATVLMILAGLATFNSRVVLEKVDRHAEFSNLVGVAVLFAVALLTGWLIHLI